MKITQFQNRPRVFKPPGEAGMTLVEVLVALLITGMVVGGIVTGYTYCTNSAEKAALSLAADARAMARLEQTRCAKWDTSSWPPVDQLVATNFPDQVVTLDVSGSSVGTTPAKVSTQISQISTNPPVKRVHVDCIWEFRGMELITNSIETFRAPDQ